jgi:O-antigen/teichoic acid export membrane protein
MVQMNAGYNTPAERIRLVNYSGATLARIVFPIFFFLLAFRYELFEVVFSNKYLDSVPLFAVSLLLLPLRAYNFTSLLQHLGKVRIVNIGAGIDLAVALILLYPLYLLLGLSGIVLSFVISTYIQCVYYLIHTARALNCGFFDLIPWRSWLGMGILFGTIAIGVHYIAIRYVSVGYTLLLGCCVTAIVVAVACIPLIRRRTHG